MSTVKTAKMLNSLLDSQKADRTRIKQLEGCLTEANTRHAAAVASAITVVGAQFKTQLDCVLARCRAEHVALTELVANKDQQIAALTADKDWQITQLKQELSGARQLLAAADASNEELCGIVDTLGVKLDKAAEEAVSLAGEREEIARQRESLNHLLDQVREHMRKKDYNRERAILNRGVLSRAAPGVNFK